MRHPLTRISIALGVLAAILLLFGVMIAGGLALYCSGALFIASLLHARRMIGTFYGWCGFAAYVSGFWIGNAGHEVVYLLGTHRSFAFDETHYERVVPTVVVPIIWLIGIAPSLFGATFGWAAKDPYTTEPRAYPLLDAALALTFVISATVGATNWEPWEPMTSLCSPCL